MQQPSLQAVRDFLVAGLVSKQTGEIPQAGAIGAAEGVQHDERRRFAAQHQGGEQRQLEDEPR